MVCTCSMHCPLSGYHDAGCCNRTECDCWCHEQAAPRASRMPPHLPSLDPQFLDALREPVPEDAHREKKGL